MEKQLLIDAIVGVGFGGSMSKASSYTNKGLARFSGNQWNPDWTWKREELAKLNETDLKEIYEDVKKED